MSKSKNTKHGKSRLVTRMNLSKNRANTMSKLAVSKGVGHEDTTGDLSAYIYSLFVKHHYKKEGVMFRVYNDFIFIFKRGKLITSWELPEHLKKRKFIREEALKTKKPFKADTDIGETIKESEIIEENKSEQSDLHKYEIINGFGNEIKEITKRINSVFLRSICDLDREVKNAKTSLGEYEKEAYISGIVRRFYQDRKTYMTHQEVMKMLSYKVYMDNFILSKSKNEDEIAQEVKSMVDICIKFAIEKQFINKNPNDWFIPISTKLPGSQEIQNFIKKIGGNYILEENIEKQIKTFYRQNLYKYLPGELNKEELLELQKSAMYKHAIGLNLKINNFYYIENIEKTATTELINEIIEKNQISIKDMSLIVVPSYDECSQIQREQLGMIAFKIALNANAITRKGIFLKASNRLCHTKIPIYPQTRYEDIAKEELYRDWCTSTIDVFIKNAILSQRDVDVEELKKTIKEPYKLCFHKFHVKEKQLEKRKKYIESTYSKEYLELESYALNKLQNTLLIDISSSSKSTEEGGNEE